MSFRKSRFGRHVGRSAAVTGVLALTVLGGGSTLALASAEEPLTEAQAAETPSVESEPAEEQAPVAEAVPAPVVEDQVAEDGPVAPAEKEPVPAVAGSSVQAQPTADAPVPQAAEAGPVANDDTLEQFQKAQIIYPIDLLFNDVGEGLKVISTEHISGASNSTFTPISGSSVYYVPDMDYKGLDIWSYTIEDANGLRDTATFTHTAWGPADAIDFTVNTTMGVGGMPGPETVLDLSEIWTQDWVHPNTDFSPNWEINETELTAWGWDREYTVMGYPGFYGTSVVRYQLVDPATQFSSWGTITVNVMPVQVEAADSTPFETPKTIDVAGLLPNGTTPSEVTVDAANGTATIVGGQLVYTPNPGFSGDDVFTVRVFDAFDTPFDVVVTMTVGEPMGVTDVTDYNTPKTVDLSSTGATGVTAVGQGTNGTVAIVDGEVVYTPNPGYVGEDSFTVEGLDAEGNPAVITVDITVAPPADEQVSTTTPHETPKTVDVLSTTGGTSVSAVGQGGNGSVAIVDGEVVHTPNPGFSGDDSFAVTVLDEFGTPVTVIVSVTVGDPMAASAQTPYETPVTIDVVDQTGATELTGTGQGSNGSAEIVDGELVYTPNPGFVGEDVVMVTVTDPNGDSVQVPVTVTVAGPEAQDLTTRTPYETPKVVDVLTETGGESVSAVGQGTNGTVTIDEDGNVVYTPNPGFVGEDEFAVTVLDEHGTPIEVTVTVTVDEPIELSTETPYETPVDVDVLGETGGTEVTGAGDGTNGTVTVDEDGTVVYTPNPGFVGEDEFPVSIIDEDGNPATVIVTVTVAGPEPVDLTTSTPYETPVTVDVLGESGGQTVTAVTQGENGTVTVDPDGTVVYTPNPGFTGVDEFTATVIDEHGNPIDVTVEVLVGDVVQVEDETPYNTPTTIDVVGETDGGTITDAGQGENGTVTVDEDGNVVYTPNPGFVGEDEFTVVVTDEDGNPTSVIVTVTVAGPEDVDTTAVTPYETPVTVDVLGESGGTAVSGTGQGTNGSVAIDPEGNVVYTPNPGFTGEDTFVVTVLDEFGTPFDVNVTVTVGEVAELEDTTPYNTPKEIDVIGETDGGTITDATDGTNGTVTVDEDGTVVYTPNPGFVGEDEFTVVVTDEDGTPTVVVVTVTVEGPAPAEVEDATNYNTPKEIDVVGETGGTVSETGQGEHGTVEVDDEGNLIYTPEPGFVGEDEFTVIVTDEYGNDQEVTVTVTVAGPEPIEVEDTTGYETPQVIEVPGEVSETGQGEHGTVEVDDEGNLIYTPDEGFVGEDTFTVVVIDEFGNEQEVTVTVTVEPPATGELATETPFEESKTIDILGETGGESISSATQGENGTVTINPDGTVTYTPNEGFSGEDTFTVTVINPDGTRSVITVTVTVGDPLSTDGEGPDTGEGEGPGAGEGPGVVVGDTGNSGSGAASNVVLATTGTSAAPLMGLAFGAAALGAGLLLIRRKGDMQA